MIPRTFRAAALFAMTLIVTPAVRACPLCESDTGRRVRAGLFDADFGYHLAVTLLPFPVFLGVVALIHFGPPWTKGRDRKHGPPDADDPPPPNTEGRP